MFTLRGTAALVVVGLFLLLAGAILPTRTIRAQSEYSFEWIAQSPYLTLTPGQTGTLWLELQNTGFATWYREGTTPVRLGTSRPEDRLSALYQHGNAGWLSANRIAMTSPTAPQGATARFEFAVTAPKHLCLHREYLRPVADGITWMDDLGIYWDINVVRSDNPGPSYAPRPEQARCFTGEIQRGGWRYAYRFEGSQGQLLEAHVKRMAGVSLKPRLELIDPDGNREASAGDGDDSALLEHRLAASGTYLLIVRAFSTTAGPYFLSWSLNRFGQLLSPAVVDAEIIEPGQRDRYRFEARQGQLLEVRMKRTAGVSSLPDLQLIDPYGNREARDAYSGGNDALIQRYLSSTGTYTIIAGMGLGPYRIEFVLDRIVPISFGQSVDGEIRDFGQQDRYTFSASRGTLVDISVERLSGPIRAHITLIDPYGNVEERQGSSQIRRQLQSSGIYMIVVSSGTETPGRYRLTLQRL